MDMEELDKKINAANDRFVSGDEAGGSTPVPVGTDIYKRNNKARSVEVKKHRPNGSAAVVKAVTKSVVTGDGQRGAGLAPAYKKAKDDSDFFKYCENAVGDGAVVFLPHVNYSRAKSSLRKIDGEFAIQQGLSSIKGVGEVAAKAIVEERMSNGIFTSYDNFLDRVQGKKVNKKVLGLLIESGALEFKKSTYISRVKKYNSSLYARAERKR